MEAVMTGEEVELPGQQQVPAPGTPNTSSRSQFQFKFKLKSKTVREQKNCEAKVHIAKSRVELICLIKLLLVHSRTSYIKTERNFPVSLSTATEFSLFFLL